MIVFLIFLITRTSAFDDNICKNQTILQTPGDALLTVFVDATFGPNCNESSSKGFQELTTALYVITALNRNDYVSGITLGLRLIDTCQDSRSVYKQCLILAADADCMNDYYNLGVLAPESYIPILQQLQNFTDLPLAFYFNENITKPLVNVATDFISRKYNTIDLLLTDSDFAKNIFLDGTRDSGICVKTINNLTKLENEDNGVIVVAAGENLIRSWIDRYPRSKKTWIILPLDDSEPDDIVPIDSYIIRSQSLTLDLEDYLNNGNDDIIVHSPHLLGIGKSLVSIAELLQDVQRNNCPGGVCSLPLFDTRLLKKLTADDVFDALKISSKSRTIKYLISQRLDPNTDDLEDIYSYEADIDNYRVVSNNTEAQLLSCMSNDDCHDCINIEKKIEITETPVVIVTRVERSTLKTDYWIPVVLVLVVAGSLVCFTVGGYIIYKFFIEEVLDGNPSLTIILIIGNILLLFSTIPFCLDEDVLGDEHLNSRKIFLTTLANGIVLSVMLSRSFFLALSTGGVFTSHINGYLQGLMLFFMSGVQIGMSTVYFIVGPTNSRDTLRSPVIIGLLSYDIFLLLTFLSVSILINQIPRNYREGKCFFITAIALVTTWLIWMTTFLLINEIWRDIVIVFGLITTAYVIIGGVLLPRVYYMITHLDPDKTCQGHIEGAELRFEPRRRSIRQKSRKSFYDYVLPMEGVRNSSGLQRRNANFYGTSSPANRRQLPDCGVADTVNSKRSGYNNYGYHNDMQETENHYVVPRVCVINSEEMRKKRGSSRSSSSDPDYAQPNYSSNMRENSFEDDCIETEIYIEGKRLSPSRKGPNESYPSRSSSPRLYQTEATINEEDEEVDQEVMKITRF